MKEDRDERPGRRSPPHSISFLHAVRADMLMTSSLMYCSCAHAYGEHLSTYTLSRSHNETHTHINNDTHTLTMAQ